VAVTVSSIAASTGSGSNIAYCGAKAAVDTMTMSLARVLAPEVRVLTVAPAARRPFSAVLSRGSSRRH
jgi:3-oxoacyl-[acyl-carrier protein] reductase